MSKKRKKKKTKFVIKNAACNFSLNKIKMLMTRCKAEKEEQTARGDRREVERDGRVIGSQMKDCSKKAKHIEELQRKKS